MAALAGIGLVVGQGSQDASRSVGPLPAFSLPRLDGQGMVSDRSLRGQPVVINFFASWCVPCRREMPAFGEVADAVGPAVTFIGIDHLDSRQGGRELVAETGIDWPVGYDPEGRVAVSLGLLGIPGTAFVSAEGQLVEVHTGELSQAGLLERVRFHFGVEVVVD